jgi:hypothetical protein
MLVLLQAGVSDDDRVDITQLKQQRETLVMQLRSVNTMLECQVRPRSGSFGGTLPYPMCSALFKQATSTSLALLLKCEVQHGTFMPAVSRTLPARHQAAGDPLPLPRSGQGANTYIPSAKSNSRHA